MSSFHCNCKLCALTPLFTYYLLCLCVSILVAKKDFEDVFDTKQREFDLLENVVREHRIQVKVGDERFRRFYHFGYNSHRNLRVSNALLQQIIPEIVSGKDITFLVTARQKPNNRGSLIAFTHQRRKRFLELQSVWQRREYRFHHLFTLAATHVHTERLPYMPADRRWHRIALTVSGTLLELRVDCRRVFSRRVPFPPPQREFVEPHREIALWVGQRGHRRSVFQGSISEAKIVTGPNGYELQCPERSTRIAVPNLQLQSLQSLFANLKEEVGDLRQRLKNAEKRLEKFEQCDCSRSCRLGSQKIQDGETVKNGSCSSCTCLNGNLNCSVVQCPPTPCKHPVWPENSCCPKCLSRCEFRGLSYEHGEASYSKSQDKKVCVICTCHDGGMRCKQYQNLTHICPKLSCPQSEQFTTDDECCNFCPGMDFCSNGNRCHKNAECINLATRYACRCRSGYSGNGYHCEDINECFESPGAPIKLCGYNSHCRNLQGSYECNCYDGFEKGPYTFCRDVDECLNKSTCPKNSECRNTVGSYECHCENGYKWNSSKCVPVCPTCQNGGICVKPYRCRCPFGFYGNFCEKDVDECALGIHNCPENSMCHNLPGSYFCQCRRGYAAPKTNNEICTDVDECKGPPGISFTCGPMTECINLVGSYKCICKYNTSCQKDCVVAPSSHRRSRVSHGTVISDTQDPCNICECQDGVLKCQRRQCNCSTTDDVLCCPSCFQGNCFDKVLNKTFKSGQQWATNCTECLCLNGTKKCHPTVCPLQRWCIGATITPVGHCCPVCTDTVRSRCHDQILSSDKLYESSERCSLNSPTVRAAIRSKPCLACQCKMNATCCTQRDDCDSKDKIP